jgi:hypothetical protein
VGGRVGNQRRQLAQVRGSGGDCSYGWRKSAAAASAAGVGRQRRLLNWCGTAEAAGTGCRRTGVGLRGSGRRIGGGSGWRWSA